ncbi:MAG: hypothetical protein WCD18_08045 [Thermosynechococcaceae cyanobacterium]
MIWGSSQTLIFPTGSVLLSADENNFGTQEGVNWQLYLGYGRLSDLRYRKKPVLTFAGKTRFVGPSHRFPYLFNWNLYVTEQTFFDIHSGITACYDSNTPMTLLDQRLALTEIAPRTRAKIGDFVADPDTPPGYLTFFPQFKVNMEIVGFTLLGDRYTLRLSGTEFDPSNPIPIAEDI